MKRFILAHADEERRLHIIGRRAANMSTAVGRVPDDVLIRIFTMARFLYDVAPELLASVCHRWLAMAHGAIGAPLWSDIELNVTPEVEIIALARKIMRYLDRSRAHPISYHLKAAARVTANDIDLLRTITRASMSRCTNLDVPSFSMFRSWFPLDGQLTLKQLHIRETLPASLFTWLVGEFIPSTVLEAPCPSLCELELSLQDAPTITTSLLANVSKFASITHLHIKVHTIREVWDSLGSFHSLQYLDWYHTGPDDGVVQGGENGAATLTLPKLERFRFYDNARLRAPSMLDAPLLRHLELTASPSHYTDLDHWALLNPDQFPKLQTLVSRTEDRDMYRIVSAIEGHPTLRNVYWEIRIQSMPESIRALSSLLRRVISTPQPPPMLLYQLDWFSIMVTKRLPPDPELEELYAEIARELARFVDIWDVLPAERRPGFNLCLSQSLVKASQEIARVVEKHPDIVLPRIHPLT